jgi:probable F420-dependent oxidoreductase
VIADELGGWHVMDSDDLVKSARGACVKFGIAMFPTDYAVDPATLGRLVEERGFESLFLPEHTHIPTSRKTPYRGGGELPRQYSHTYDPFVALTAAAAATEGLKLATGICLIVERDPITTAKAVASLDRLSEGRFLFGVGAGWNREEMEDHGTDPARRFGLMRERVEAMKAIWTEDEAEYHGKYVDFDPIWSWPKPHQRPHPPVLVGGNGETVIDRVLRFGDEWMPNRVGDVTELKRRVDELRDRAGRRVPVTFSGTKPDRETVEAYAAAGIDRCVFYVQPEPAAEVEASLDRYAELVEG